MFIMYIFLFLHFSPHFKKIEKLFSLFVFFYQKQIKPKLLVKKQKNEKCQPKT